MTMSKRSEWEPTPESHEYLARMRVFLGWDDALYRAYKHDTAKLSDYLRRLGPAGLDQEKLDQLADLLDHVIHRRKEGKGRKLGRKPGRIPLPDNIITLGRFVSVARDSLHWIRQRNHGKAPHGSYQAAIEEAREWLLEEGYTVNINMQQALKTLKRGRR
jgi:hypothetical protein